MKPFAIAVEWLTDEHRELKAIEEQAQKALYEHKDEARYRALMRMRAEHLAALPHRSLIMQHSLPETQRLYVSGKLLSFAQGARNALELDSVFYMSALLYPDDHKPGEPDNMERLIEALDSGRCNWQD